MCTIKQQSDFCLNVVRLPFECASGLVRDSFESASTPLRARFGAAPNATVCVSKRFESVSEEKPKESRKKVNEASKRARCPLQKVILHRYMTLQIKSPHISDMRAIVDLGIPDGKILIIFHPVKSNILVIPAKVLHSLCISRRRCIDNFRYWVSQSLNECS